MVSGIQVWKAEEHFNKWRRVDQVRRPGSIDPEGTGVEAASSLKE